LRVSGFRFPTVRRVKDMKALHLMTVQEAMSEQRNVYTIACYVTDGICYLSLGTSLHHCKKPTPRIAKRWLQINLFAGSWVP